VKHLLSLICLSLLATTCFAQFETATVLGTVKDSTGAVIVGGKVTLENVKRTGSIFPQHVQRRLPDRNRDRDHDFQSR